MTLDTDRERSVRPNLVDLLEGVSRKDREDFAALYDETCSPVYGLALRILRNEAMAEEVTQEVFLQVWENAIKYSSSKGQPLTWILTICHRRAVDRVRSEESRKKREAEYVPAENCGVAAEDSVLLTKTMECLTEGQKEIIGLVYFSGCTAREAAEKLSIPTATAKTRLRDGLIKLRKEWRG